MRFSSLGSGSEGNALVVEQTSDTTTTRILLDCGFSAKEISRRLERVGLCVEDLDAILITHEHSDHIGSALTLCRRFSIPLYTSWGTAQAMGAVGDARIALHLLQCSVPLALRDFQIRPYTVPHDAREPLQFVFSDGSRTLGVLTDAGCGTSHITQSLQGCDALVLECNHDRSMLANSRYHAALKARIGGTLGHLANDSAAEILGSLNHSRLRHLVAAHLSKENNQAALARTAINAVWGRADEDVIIATQDEGFAWLTL
ncbi:MBL fold metallo-hydrolase [Robbsia andropogonis]|uniref:MBL fold metallo-hydrolase n=1 Tax=Robbsia andropogonis TaxID=28092 RepID=UPI000463BE93|nr:MBL fold metallo-hydrolase [Robbsia andropogonis]MCP1120167.1 MBL fold metallo-hydrolase [Robbsia andropogonis]MCP1130001.1 MBL fold metallo-hydrolase [Robbsia andropogonis]